MSDQITSPHNERSTAEELINKPNSLTELFGEGWEEDVFRNSLEDAFSYSEIEAIERAQYPLPHEALTPIDKSAVELNAIFHSKSASFKGYRYTDHHGSPKIFIEGHIGQDRMYQVISNSMIRMGDNRVVWSPDKVGFVSPTGKVFSLDALANRLNNTNNRSPIEFVEVAGREFGLNHADGENGLYTLMAAMPKDVVSIGILMHELGHVARGTKLVKSTPEQDELKWKSAALQTGARRDSKDYPNEVTLRQARRINVREERSAWAIGISLLREAHRRTGLEMGSNGSIEQIIQRSEYSLGTYDESYYFVQHNGEERIPSYSREERKASRRLHSILREKDMNYSDLENFDIQTGENIASQPSKLIRNAEEIDLFNRSAGTQNTQSPNTSVASIL